ncbi:MAG: hypothetical protein KDN20_15455 [Verrucomicrobiae bacterium]|nr:hypothetical protein [Verrucomicrobiae bacterium]
MNFPNDAFEKGVGLSVNTGPEFEMVALAPLPDPTQELPDALSWKSGI